MPRMIGTSSGSYGLCILFWPQKRAPLTLAGRQYQDASRRRDRATPIMRIVTATFDQSTLRRAVAVICALAFLFVGLAHTVQHIDAAVPSIALQTGSDHSDGSPDVPGTVDHCHGCVMVAIPVVGAAALPSRIGTTYP